MSIDFSDRVESLCLDLVITVLTECNLNNITRQREHQYSFLVSVNVYYVKTQYFKRKGTQLDGFHALKQVIIPDIDHASHGSDCDAFETFGDCGDFVFVVFQNSDIRE